MIVVDMDQRHHHLIPNSGIPENSNNSHFAHHQTNAILRVDSSKHHHLHRHHHHHHQQQQQFSGSNPGWNSISHDIQPDNVSSHPISSSIRGMGMDPRFGENSGISSKGKIPNALADNFGGGIDVVNQREQIQGFFPQVESSGAQAMITQQMESPFGHHHRHHHHGYGQIHHGNYFTPVWGQYGANPGDGVHTMWHYPAIPCFPAGRNSNPSSSEIPFYSQCQQPVPAIIGNPNLHYVGVQTAYGLPVNNILHPLRIHMNPLLRNSRPFPLGSSIRSNRSNRQPPHSTQSSSGSRMRILTAEEFNGVDFMSFYGAENFFDRHRDLRLDIDNMSYEELLALGEQIGEVKTGLSREAISNKLKTRAFHLPESGSCIVCQVEYSENEKIGTLDCGHEYHADCISEWLMVKNLCPVCKTTAVPADERER